MFAYVCTCMCDLQSNTKHCCATSQESLRRNWELDEDNSTTSNTPNLSPHTNTNTTQRRRSVSAEDTLFDVEVHDVPENDNNVEVNDSVDSSHTNKEYPKETRMIDVKHNVSTNGTDLRLQGDFTVWSCGSVKCRVATIKVCV